VLTKTPKKILGSKKGEVKSTGRKYMRREIHSTYFSPTVIRVIKSGRI
jgi:hypothetical protein